MHTDLREPIIAQSKKQEPFCPDCGKELDSLDMHNYHDTCECGQWWYDDEGKAHFAEKEEQ